MKLLLEVSATFVDIDVLGSLKDTLLGIGIVFVMLAILIAVVVLIGLSGKIKKKKTAPEAPSAPAPAQKAAPVYPDTVELYGTDEKTAAMIMAIVASESGIPANELRFISIREM